MWEGGWLSARLRTRLRRALGFKSPPADAGACANCRDLKH
jgi:hypothetical protein